MSAPAFAQQQHQPHVVPELPTQGPPEMTSLVVGEFGGPMLKDVAPPAMPTWVKALIAAGIIGLLSLLVAALARKRT